MNKEEINKTFFESLHEVQMNQMNTSALKDARKVILNLMLYISAEHGDVTRKDQAVSEALKWLKNNQS
tara:strand:- start:378 stop:581 length:204 start_codon:yes stop_codon:yes gene_type:complete